MSIEFFDMLGRSMKIVQVSGDQPGSYQTDLPTQDFPAGTYYYKAKVGNGNSRTGKMMKWE
jgi:hypothetical protein